MKKKIILKRIFHRDEWRYGLFFDIDPTMTDLVKSIRQARWSETRKCWHVPAEEDTLRVILELFRGRAEIDISGIALPSEIKQAAARNPVNPAVNKLPDNEKAFANPLPSPVTGKKVTVKNSGAYDSVRFSINEPNGRLIIKFLGFYNQGWIREMRSYGNIEYDSRRKEWLLPYSKLTCDSLADYFAGQGVGVNVTKEAINDDLKAARKLTGDEIRSKPLGKQALDGLEMMTWFLDDNRYSPRTRESYLAMLEFFFRYFSPVEPSDIGEEEISRFLYDFIIKLGYSASYQNQMVSAIKTYYSIARNRKVDPEFLERPRRSRALPKVFSKEEVTRILNSGGNLKHKMLLWLIYSCGLRRSEVTNLKLTDLDRERGILHVREGKGRVDRFVPVPAKVWEKLDEYFSGYKPKQYLFEGQSGGRYSSESVYRVFKDTLVKAGIRKDVGVHSLRHSYATHLHENGLDIRYIQELLGHKSTRTTEIYTHVSRRNLVAVRSPIEDLDLK